MFTKNKAENVMAGQNVIVGDNNTIVQNVLPNVNAVLNAPDAPAAEYCGHETDIDDVCGFLEQEHRVLIYTWGGLGKTEFALKLAEQKYRRRAYFFDCSSSFDNALIECVSGTTDYNERLAAAKIGISMLGDSLLIFDNIQSTADAKKIVEYFGNSSVHILLTSRKELNAAGYKKYELPFLSEDEAFEVFRRYHSEFDEGELKNYTEEETKCVGEIVRLSGLHTLTLELLAKTCRESGRSVGYLLEKMREKGFSLEGVMTTVARKNSDDYKRFIEHLEKLFDIADIESSHSELIPLMKTLSVLDVTDIPIDTLTRWCGLDDNEKLNELYRMGWLRKKRERYSMHNVVSETLVRKLAPSFNDARASASAILSELNKACGDDKLKYVYQPAEAQAASLLRHFDDENRTLGDIAFFGGWLAYEQGRYGDSLRFYKRAVPVFEKVLGTEHPDTATSYNNIGIVYKDRGDYDAALEYYNKALAIREKGLGTEHPDTAVTYVNIGALYYEKGEYDKATEQLIKAYKVFFAYGHIPYIEAALGWLNAVYKKKTFFPTKNGFEKWLSQKLRSAE